MRTFIAFLALFAGLAPAPPAMAAERPVVGVTFKLNDPRLRNSFQPAQLTQLEAHAAETIAKRLGERIGFVSFSSQASGTHALMVRLEAIPQASPFKETVLQMELSGAGVAGRSLNARFRPAERYGEPSGGVEGLVREIDLRIKDTDFRALIQDVLSHVPIAHEAKVWKDPVGWIIPYRKADLCMDFRSVLRIENMLPSGAGPVLKEFMARASADFSPREAAVNASRGHIFTEPVPAQDGIAELRSARAEDVTIRGIYVVEYLQLAPCTGPVPVEAVDFRGGRP